MKYTHLFGAAVLAVALGTQGLATVTTNDVASQNFDGVSITGLVSNATIINNLNDNTESSVGRWIPDPSGEDLSEILYGPISATQANPGKHLELKTEGKELTWEPGTINQPESIIEMKVRLVASDTVPGGLTGQGKDESVHAAVYLRENESDKTDIALCALSWDTTESDCVWTDLVTVASMPGLTNGCMMALRVLVNYNSTGEGAKTATYEAAILNDPTEASPNYINLGTIPMANPGTISASATLSQIAFKGTGGVDDLIVRKVTRTPSTATFAPFEVWEDGEENATYVDSQRTLDTEAQGSSWTGFVDFDTTFNPATQEVKSFSLSNVTDSVSCEWTIEPTLNNDYSFTISMANYTFQPDKTYFIKVMVGNKVVNHTVTFNANGHGTAPTAQTIEDGAKATEPVALTAEGWAFKGWTLDGAAYDFNTAVTNDITLVASWKQLFTVTFDANGHGTAPAAQSVEDGATATDPGALTAEGYTFNGWTLGGSAYSFSTPVTGNITLVADWSEASSELEAFSIGDNLPQGVAPVVIDGNKFIVNVVVPQGVTATLVGSDTLNGTFTNVNAVATAKTGYTELAYTMGGNETAKFFRVKFSK